MPATILDDQITGPRVSRKNRTAEFDYVVLTPTDAEDAENAVLGVAAADYRGWPLDDVITGPMGPDHYRVTVRYAAAGGGLRPQTGDVNEAWSTGGGTERIKTSKETVEASVGAPDQRRAINVVDGKIEGVDVVVPAWSETITAYVDSASIGTVKAAAFAAHGTVNDDTFRGFAAGEVLLANVTGKKRSEGDWEVNYQFLCRPNRVNVEIADSSFVISALEGWHHVWVLYRETVESNQTTMKAAAYYVERVYDYSDFAALDLE